MIWIFPNFYALFFVLFHTLFNLISFSEGFSFTVNYWLLVIDYLFFYYIIIRLFAILVIKTLQYICIPLYCPCYDLLGMSLVHRNSRINASVLLDHSLFFFLQNLLFRLPKHFICFQLCYWGWVLHPPNDLKLLQHCSKKNLKLRFFINS